MLAQQSEQQVLGAGVVVLERAGLLLSQGHGLPGALGEPLEQGPRIPPAARASKLRPGGGADNRKVTPCRPKAIGCALEQTTRRKHMGFSRRMIGICAAVACTVGLAAIPVASAKSGARTQGTGGTSSCVLGNRSGRIK